MHRISDPDAPPAGPSGGGAPTTTGAGPGNGNASNQALIPVAGPWVTDREVAYVAEAARDGWYGAANTFQDRFERAFASYVGVRHAIALPSCTAGLHLALAAAGVGPGDEVVVPDLTWIATAAPVCYVGATPVFADVARDTWCVSAATVEACLSPRTRAVIVVDLYGGVPGDIDAIRALCAAHGLLLIEDAAEAVGASHGDRRAGSLGDVGVFSFHGTKTMTTGEGGMLVTEDEAIWRRACFLRDHGRAPGPPQFWNTEVAFKYRMSALQAAFGLAQLERVDELVERKRQLFAWYKDALADLDAERGGPLTLNFQAPGTQNAYWMVTALVDGTLGLDKESLLSQLRAHGIDGRPFFYPLSTLPAFAQFSSAAEARDRNHVAAELHGRGVNLPSAMILTRADVQRVAVALRAILARR